MARGLPDNPPEEIKDDFVDAGYDDTCPTCGWDPDDAMQDQPRAHAEGLLLAIELAEGPVFGAMQGAQPLALYWRCPTRPATEKPCATLFTVEVEDISMGGMA